MAKQFAQAGISNPIRFSAIDASKGFENTGYTPHKWGPYWTLRNTEIAVFESHRALWKEIYASGKPGAIFEDDVFLSKTAGDILARFDGLNCDFSMVKLDALREEIRLGGERVLCGETVRPIMQVVPSAAAYVLSPKTAQDLLKRTECYCDHVDDTLTKPIPGYRAMQLMQAIAVQGMFADISGRLGVPSSIFGSERTTARPIQETYDRGPASYRILKELRRTARKISRRLFSDNALVRKGGYIGIVPLAEDLPNYK
ncbi:glycosyltransferase family 25 protein [Pseudosulfitobacter pseudonitzschiae]|nr:glycosyltransferase family 25 protein [Pseudosulfitobacter pseudonitzschiae]